MSGIRTFFRHCPSCGRRFEIRLVSKESVDSETHSGEVKRTFNIGIKQLSTLVQADVPIIVDSEDFQYTYRCKHCGHQWSEVRETDKTFDAPKGYTGD